MKKIILLLCLCAFLGSCSEQAVDQSTQGLSEPKTILALGASLTEGYGVAEEESYPSRLESKMIQDGYNYRVINAGISGHTSGQTLARLEDYDIPDILILQIGGNDGLQNNSLEKMKENLNSIIDYYKERDVKVILSAIPIPPIHGFKYSREFRNVYTEIAKERKGKIYFYDSFLDGVGGVSKYNQSDKIHPTSEGYRIITDNLYNYLLDEGIISK